MCEQVHGVHSAELSEFAYKETVQPHCFLGCDYLEARQYEFKSRSLVDLYPDDLGSPGVCEGIEADIDDPARGLLGECDIVLKYHIAVLVCGGI